MNQDALDLQPQPEYREIPLTQGFSCKIDLADYEWLNQWHWYAVRVKGKFVYASRNINGKMMAMHRFIMGSPHGLMIDHRNHDTLDNRRGNLRVATRAQNNQNRKLQKNNTSGFRGVKWHRNNGSKKQWCAFIKDKGKVKTIGHFLTKEEASAAYEAKAKELFGEFYNPL